MTKKKSYRKIITSAVISTAMLFSLVNSAIANTPGVTTPLQVQEQEVSVDTVANVENEQNITVRSITATNGSVSVKLSDVPDKAPELEDFTFTWKINDKSTALKAKMITWNDSTKTAYFTLKTLNATKVAQKVVITAEYNGSQKSAKSFTIAGKGAEVDKVQIVNNAANASLIVGSEDDATLLVTAVAKDKSGNIVTGKKVTWTSSNPKVASVDRNGKVKAVAAGKAEIMATINDKEAALKVTVTEPKVDQVEITNSAVDAEMTVGSKDDSTVVLTAIAKEKNGTVIKGKKVTWSSENPKVATVDDEGKVTAVAAGKAKIKALVDRKSAQFEVSVKGTLALTLGAATLSESAANDGSITATQTVTLENGTFASDITASDVTVNNLPSGLGVNVTRNNDTQLTIAFTRRASSHVATDSRNNLSVTINKAKIYDAKEDLVSGHFSMTFENPAVVNPPGGGDSSVKVPKTITESGTYGPESGTTTVYGDLTIGGSGTNVTLQNLIVTGKIILDNNGEVTLKNVTAKQVIEVKDVAEHSLNIEGVTAPEIKITDSNGARINVIGSMKVTKVTLMPTYPDTPITLYGNFGDTPVYITHPAKLNLHALLAVLHISREAADSSITITEGNTIGVITGDGSDAVKATWDDLKKDADELEIGFAEGDTINSVTKNITFPTSGKRGTAIRWQSFNGTSVGANGTIFRSSTEDGGAVVTAHLTKNKLAYGRDFTITVKAKATAAELKALQDAVTAAQAKHDGAIEGTDGGNYTTGAKAPFQTAITKADTVAKDERYIKNEVNDALPALQEAEKAFDAEKVASADELKVLTDAVAQAQAKHDGAVEGTAGGEYLAGAKAPFQTAITEADTVAKKVGVTKVEVDQAVTALQAAEKAFNDVKYQIVDETKTTISIDKTNLRADGKSSATITVQAIDPDGQNVRRGGAVVTLATTAGTISNVTDHGDGTYTATLTAGNSAGNVEVTGAIDGKGITGATAKAYIHAKNQIFIESITKASNENQDVYDHLTLQFTDPLIYLPVIKDSYVSYTDMVIEKMRIDGNVSKADVTLAAYAYWDLSDQDMPRLNLDIEPGVMEEPFFLHVDFKLGNIRYKEGGIAHSFATSSGDTFPLVKNWLERNAGNVVDPARADRTYGSLRFLLFKNVKEAYKETYQKVIAEEIASGWATIKTVEELQALIDIISNPAAEAEAKKLWDVRLEVAAADQADATKVTDALVAEAQKLVAPGYTVSKKADGTFDGTNVITATLVVEGTGQYNKTEVPLTLFFDVK